MVDTDHRASCLALVPLFQGLDADTLGRIAAVTTTRSVARGEILQAPGDPSAMLVLHRGRARVSRIASGGTSQLLRILQPGDFIGETAALAPVPVTDHVEAVEACEVCRLEAVDLEALAQRDARLALQLARALAARLREAEDRLSAGSTTSVARRLADRLLQLAELQGSDLVQPPSTRRDMAAWLGTTPETLSRRLGHFQDAGLIRIASDGRIRIMDFDGLRAVPDRA